MSHTHRWMGEITWTHVMNIWYSTSICHVTHRILLLMMNDISLAIGMVRRYATHKCHKWHVTHRISVLIFKIRDIPLVTVTVKRYATYKCHKCHVPHRILLLFFEYVTFHSRLSQSRGMPLTNVTKGISRIEYHYAFVNTWHSACNSQEVCQLQMSCMSVPIYVYPQRIIFFTCV